MPTRKIKWLGFLLCLVLLVGCSAPLSAPLNPTSVPAVLAATGVPADIPADAPADVAAAATAAPTVSVTAEPQMSEGVFVIRQLDQAIAYINLQTSTASSGINLAGTLGPMTVGEGSVWVVQTLGNNPSTLLRINPQTFNVDSAISVEIGQVTAITAGGGSVWLGIREAGMDDSNRPPGSLGPTGGVARVDLQANTVAEYVRRSATPSFMVFSERSLWVLEQMDTASLIERFDLDVLRWTTLPSQVPSADYVYYLSAIAPAAHGVWGISPDTRSRFFYRIQPETGQVVNILPTGDGAFDSPVSIAADGQNVWVLLRSGKLLRVNPSTGGAEAIANLRPGSSWIFLSSGSLWVDNPAQAELARLDPTSLQVLAIIKAGMQQAATPTRGPRALEPTEIPACEADYLSRLHKGDLASVATDPPYPNRIREQPKAGMKVLGEIQPGELIRIIDGPTCEDGWYWWQVRSEQTGLTGWTAEGDKDAYWLVPEQ